MKTGNYLPNVLAKRELERLGMIEGIVLATTDAVVSGVVSNLFLVKDGLLRTPDLASGCRPGVTREIIIRLADALDLRVEERPIAVSDLADADEAFFTNTLMECLPVRRVDGHELESARPDSISRRLHEAYRAGCTP
jgi:branched-subunit amino acid aminotransferase/4-amino-4-deoxychorismate lyase